MNSTLEKKNIFNTFMNGYFDLLNFVKKYSNNNKDFNQFYMKNYLLKKTNIKLFIKTWYQNITTLYYQPIMNENISFFLDKNYEQEVTKSNNQFNISYYISYFKQIYKTLDNEIFQSFVDRIKRLTHLSYMYYTK